MKPGLCFVAMLLWAAISIPANSSSMAGPAGAAAVPVQTAGPAAEPGRPAPANASPSVVNGVKFTVRDKKNAPVPGAKVKVSKGTNGNAISTRTNDRGVATFSALPAVDQVVNVTAEGYVSYSGTVDLRRSRTEFEIKLAPRE